MIRYAKITASAAGAALAGTLSGGAIGSQPAVAGAVPLLAAAVGAAGFAHGTREPAPHPA